MKTFIFLLIFISSSISHATAHFHFKKDSALPLEERQPLIEAVSTACPGSRDLQWQYHEVQTIRTNERVFVHYGIKFLVSGKDWSGNKVPPTELNLNFIHNILGKRKLLANITGLCY
jgi:hypothetical protein